MKPHDAHRPAAPAARAAPHEVDEDKLYDVFTSWAGEQGITLYPAQEEAFLEILTGSNVILSTPTGSGKSLVATGRPRRPRWPGASGPTTPRRSRRW